MVISQNEPTNETNEYKFSWKKNEFWGTVDDTRISTQRNFAFLRLSIEYKRVEIGRSEVKVDVLMG